MAVNTQPSQLRLAQRGASGNWAVPDVIIEGTSADGTDGWVDITENFTVLVNRFVSVGGQVNYSFIGKRDINSIHNVFRLVFEDSSHSISVPQVVGELAVVSEDITGENLVRTWSRYPLVAVPEGRLETISPATMNWQEPYIGDIIQFYGTWFI